MKKQIMKRAWEIRRAAAQNHGCSIMEIEMSECLKMAWSESKGATKMEKIAITPTVFLNGKREFTLGIGEYRGQTVVVADQFNDKNIPQYFRSWEPFGSKNRVVISVGKHGYKNLLVASATLCDGDEHRISGYSLNRVIFERESADVTPENAARMLADAISAVENNADFTPERVRYEERVQAHAAFLQDYPECPTRSEYERFCETLGIQSLSDRDAKFYAKRSLAAGCWYSYTVAQMNSHTVHTKYGLTVPEPPPRVTMPVEMRRCDCGHTVPVGSVMGASLGTSCPDCYDRMSA